MKKTDTFDKAVALQYDSALPAPVVVARGWGWQAESIRRAAEAAGVPVVRDSVLAGRLAELRTGSFIPETCFEVVAALYRFVYELRQDTTGTRHEQDSDK